MDKICSKCGHEPCTICKDFCDKTVKQEDGTWDICDCFFTHSGKCVYEVENNGSSISSSI